MLNLIVNSARVSYDSLEEAKAVSKESGLGLAFWRETFSECAENEGMWNAFLNDLWQSGAEDEAERLNLTFPKDAPRHWLLVALMLDGDDPWGAFLTEWETRGDERIMAVVNRPAFVPWLKQVQPMKYGLLLRAFGEDVAKWPNDLLLKALKSDGSDAEVAGWQTIVENRNEPRPGEEMAIPLPGGVSMTFCWCPATTSEEWKKISGGEKFFWMGSSEKEKKRAGDEVLHKVTLTHGFWISKYAVTQWQWESIMGENPSAFVRGDCPVEQVSWADCQKFVRGINAMGQGIVALPTEAQWEYACRAGTMTPYSFGMTLNGDKANCNGKSPYGTTVVGLYREETTPVGLYEPNAWGIYDMHGNVWEWCQDWYGDYESESVDPEGPVSGSDRVIRGGAWHDGAHFCRSAVRVMASPELCGCGVGLRLVCFSGLRR